MMVARIAGIVAIVLVGAAGVVWVNYRSSIGAARERVSGKSTVISSPYGKIEYTEGGAGPAVLIVHASGGGFDQGELIAQQVLDERFRWIAPSRFGYLRSSVPAGATFDDQAHAYAWLLDHLGVKKVAVVAYSHGGPSALLFALLHPERVSSLALVSCGVTGVSSKEGKQADKKGAALVWIYKKDFRYWFVTTMFKKQFMKLMGASDAVIRGLDAGQLKAVERVIDYMNPASQRSAGTVFDNKAAMPGGRISGIKAPTLIIHAEDDAIQLYPNAEFASSTIPGARLMRFKTGGHLLMIIEQAAIRAAVQEHILQNVK